MEKETKNDSANCISVSNEKLADTEKGTCTHRTKGKAGDTAEIPDRLPIITNRQYQYAMTLNKNDAAYLQMVSDNSRLNFKKGVLLLDDFPVTSEGLKELFTEEGVEKINF